MMTARRSKRKLASTFSPLSPSDRANRFDRIFDLLGEWDTLARLNDAKCLGSRGRGNYGEVVGKQIGPDGPTGERLAIKTVRSEEKEANAALAFEAMLGGFLSTRLRTFTPHICDYYAYSIDEMWFDAQLQLVPSPWIEEYHTLTLMNMSTMTLSIELASLFVEDNTAAIFALLVQSFAAMAALHRMGVSHNDFRVDNLLLDRCAMDATIRYKEHPGNAAVRTYGWAVSVCDFGCSTQQDFWDSGADSRSADNQTICDMYMNAERGRMRRPPGLRIFHKGCAIPYHPLQMGSFQPFEIDFVCFCNFTLRSIEMFVERSTRPTHAFVRPVEEFMGEILRTLAETKAVVDYAAFAMDVCSPEFVGRFIEKGVFVSAKLDAFEYELPQGGIAEALRKQCAEALSAKVFAEEIVWFE